MNINEWYASTLASIMAHGPREVNKRTGMECAALPGLTYQTDLLKDGFPLLSLREIPVKNFVAEQCWFLSGSRNVRDLEKYTKLWSAFAEESGNVTSAYGYRWRHLNSLTGTGTDQLQIVLDKLKNDSSSRHGVIMMWQPEMDLKVPQKNVPCPYTFTLMIIGGKLHMHLIVRSNDMVLGFPTDVAGFAFLQLILAQKLRVEPGTYTHSISNAHIYSNHYDAANEMIQRYSHEFVFPGERYNKPLPIFIPPHAYEKASAMDNEFITYCIQNFGKAYEPLPKIKGLTISL